MRTFCLAVTCAALTTCTASTASAVSTISYSVDLSTLIVTGGDNANHELQFRLHADGNHDEILDDTGFTAPPGDCDVVTPTRISCPAHVAVQVDLGSGNDKVYFTGSNF